VNAWRTLGLERTADVNEIRRAYAQRLKATDVDADPDAFIALRQALETALFYARRHQPAPPQSDGPEAEAPKTVPVIDHWPMEPAATTEWPDEDLPVARHGPHDRFQRLDAILFGNPEEWPDPEALAAAVREILDHPEMDNVDEAQRVGYWLARMLEAAIPRSDPALPMTVEHFGWDRQAGQWDVPWEIAGVVERARALQAVDRLSDPQHRYHDAWLELSSEEPELGINRLWKRRKVRELLRQIRAQCPEVENMVPAYRVQAWESTPGAPMGQTARNVVLGAWLLYIGVRMLVAFASSPVTSNPSEAPLIAPSPVLYQDAGRDLDPVLHSLSPSVSLGVLREDNPALYQRLIDHWEQARAASRSRYVFENEATGILDAEYHRGLRGGGVDLQREYWQLRVDEFRWLRDAAPNGGGRACDRYMRDGVAPRFPADLEVRREGMMARVLRTPPERSTVASDGRGRFAVPEAIFQGTVRRAGLSPATVQAALTEGGDADQRCTARIALIQEVLSRRPREAAPVLRDMSRAL
jgi:hypothetical protein